MTTTNTETIRAHGKQAAVVGSRSTPEGGADQGTESSDDREGAGVDSAQEPGVRGWL